MKGGTLHEATFPIKFRIMELASTRTYICVYTRIKSWILTLKTYNLKSANLTKLMVEIRGIILMIKCIKFLSN